MRLPTGPRLITSTLLLVYLAFLAWYGGRSTPLTPQETEAYIAEIRQRGEAAGHVVNGNLLEELRRLAASDDGNEYYMLNLIRFRTKAQYPPGSPWGGDALEADARYSRAMMPLLFKHGAHPLMLAAPQGRFMDEAGDTEWSRIALVRYRSRRDMLEMIVDIAALDIGVHKWASIEKTHVFPVRSMFDLFAVRGLVAVVLIALGMALHALLRRRARPQGARA